MHKIQTPTRKMLLFFPILAGLVVLPRLSIDLYLPALPRMVEAFHSSQASMKMTLTIFMFGYAISMLIAGPLSDSLGRKKVLIGGLSLYLIATISCIFAASVDALVFSRFLQALGGCCGTVIARVIVRDMYSKTDQIRLLAHLSAVMAICPLVIPIIGGWVQLEFGWQLVFYILSVFGASLLFLVTTQIQETNSAIQPVSLRKMLAHYKMLLTHRIFIAYSLNISLAWCCYFAFTLESPFLLQNNLGISSMLFGVLFALVVLGYLIGTQIVKHFSDSENWDRLIFMASWICFFGAVVMLIWAIAFPMSWLGLVIPMIIVMMGVGIIIPCTQAAVMQPFSEIAGTTSGLFFFIQMAFGGICGLLLRFFTSSESRQWPMVLVIFISSIFLVASFYFLIWRKRKPIGY